MRIAIDVLIAEKEPGGLLFSARALLEGLASIDQTNEYFIITGRPKEYQALASSPNMHIYPIRLLSWKGIMIQHQMLLQDALRQIKPDVLHVSSYAAPIGWNGPLVVTVHDLSFLKVPQQSSLYPRLYWKYLLHESVNRAQRIITISQQSYEEIVDLWRVETERIRIIHNAIRPSLRRKDISSQEIAVVRQRYGEHYLLHVGRIMPRKNVETLIDAFDLVARRFDDLHLVLTGGLGYGSEEVLNQIKASRHAEKIHLAGWVSDSELGLLYTGASALVFPSKHEGFGLPTLEAMVCGTPVIASYEAASQEIAGDAVVRVDCSNEVLLAEAIEQVLTDEPLRETLTRQGYEQIKPFTVEACAEATLQVYKEAVGFNEPHNEQQASTHVATYPRVSVIIPTSRPEQAALAIESLTKQDYQGGIEIVVVGVNITPLSQRWSIIPVSCSSMPGPAKARNMGVAQATGDIVMFLDDDCTAPQDWVALNVEALRQPNIGAVGGAVHGLSSSFIARCTDYTNFGDFQHGSLKEQPLAAASMSIPYSVFQEVGGFSEARNYGGDEDTDLCHRIQQLGYRTLYIPTIKVIHDHRRNKLGKLLSHNYKYGLSSGLLTKAIHRDISLKNRLLYSVRFPPLFLLLFPFFALFTTMRIVIKNITFHPNVVLYAPVILLAKLSYQFGVFQHLLKNRHISFIG